MLVQPVRVRPIVREIGSSRLTLRRTPLTLTAFYGSHAESHLLVLSLPRFGGRHCAPDRFGDGEQSTAEKVMRRRRLKVEDCLWVRSPNSEHPIFMPITRALESRGAKTFSLQIRKDPDSLARLKEMLWKRDTHVI